MSAAQEKTQLDWLYSTQFGGIFQRGYGSLILHRS
jgi:hypothetical protein